MGFIPAPNTMKAETRFTYHSQQVENVMYFRKEGAIELADFSVVGNNIVDSWNTHIKVMVSSELSFDAIKFTDASSESGPTLYYTTGLPLVGSLAGAACLPGNVTAVASLNTAKRGKSYHGRLYHVGITEAETIGNVLQSNMRASITAYLEEIMGNCHIEGYDLCVVSFYHNGAPRVTAEVTPVATIVVNGTLDSQRRRLPGRGK